MAQEDARRKLIEEEYRAESAKRNQPLADTINRAIADIDAHARRDVRIDAWIRRVVIAGGVAIVVSQTSWLVGIGVTLIAVGLWRDSD